MSHSEKRVVIVGGGFGGIRTALDLAKQAIPGLTITLIADKPHFEYYPTLYHVVTGHSALQSCIPITEIFAETTVKLEEDFVTKVDLKNKVVSGNSSYGFDYLVLALGSETGYFNISGLPEHSYGFKSIHEAMELKNHFHQMLTPIQEEGLPAEQKVISAHFMIVGGGPTGVELAGELGNYARVLAAKHGYDPSLITIDLIEAAPRLLPTMPVDISEAVKKQLQKSGVNIFLNRTVIKQEMEELIMKDSQVKTRTVIWTAGVKANRLIAQIEGLELDKRGKVVVNEYLQAKGHNSVLVVGDSASTQYSGMAQTADHDGAFVADFLKRKLTGASPVRYQPSKPIYAIPAGQDWATVLWGSVRLYGKPAAWLRHMADLRYFASILPLNKALKVLNKDKVLAESCPICTNDQTTV